MAGRLAEEDIGMPGNGRIGYALRLKLNQFAEPGQLFLRPGRNLMINNDQHASLTLEHSNT